MAQTKKVARSRYFFKLYKWLTRTFITQINIQMTNMNTDMWCFRKKLLNLFPVSWCPRRNGEVWVCNRARAGFTTWSMIQNPTFWCLDDPWPPPRSSYIIIMHWSHHVLATYLTFSETTAMSQPPDPASQGSYTLVQTLPVWPPQIPTQLSHREFSGARDIIQCFKMVMLCA